MDTRPLGDVTVLVTELESAVLPAAAHRGRVLDSERKHYHFKVFKPLEEVAEEDVLCLVPRRARGHAGRGLWLLLS